MEPKTLRKGIEHLSKDDNLRPLIEEYKKPIFKKTNYFKALAKSIIYQQLSTKSAKAIHARFLDLSKKNSDLRILSNLKDSELKKIGLSKQKTLYIKELAKYFYQKKSINFSNWPNEEISKELQKIKGIGPWTTDMFLMFTVFRTDILPVGDLGIQKGFKKLFNLKKLPSKEYMITKSKNWQPYRTIACCYLWKLVEGDDAW